MQNGRLWVAPHATIPFVMGASERGRRWTFPILIVALSLAGCSGEQSGSGRTYTMRGQVIQLPDPKNPGTGLTLNHEAIDDWVSRDGETVGMDPMTMSFLVDEKVPLEEIQVTDVVEVKLHVDWGGQPEVEIVEIRELPPGTKLVFRAAKPKKDRT